MIHLSRRVLQCLAKELAHEGFKPQRVEDDDCFDDVRISCLPRRPVSIRESVSLVIFSSAATIRLGCSSAAFIGC
jgi:hypothetical protein